MNERFKPYDESVLDIIINETWEVSDKPFMLHAAFAISTLYDSCSADEDEEESNDINRMWGCTIPKNILDRMVADIKEDFNDAAENRKQLKIFDKSYSIRRVNSYDKNRLHLIFNFPVKDDEYMICKEGIINLADSDQNQGTEYEVSRQESQENRTYLRQIIKLAEDDNDGWDKLTDMEVIIYCWGQFYNKYQSDNIIRFLDEYKDYLYVKESDIPKCYNKKASLRNGPAGMYTFSFQKTQEWNKANKQHSYAAEISQQEADDYWYDVALKTTFKPIDLK